MLNLAHTQVLKGRFPTNTAPTFLAPIVAQHGEFSEDTFRTIELGVGWLWRAMTSAPPRDDGLTPKEAAAAYRKRFKDRLAAKIAQAGAQIYRSTGIAPPSGLF